MEEERNRIIYRYIFPDGEIYIGQSTLTLQKRWAKGYYYDSRIRDCINKYGRRNPNIQKDVLMENLTKAEANNWEQYYVQECRNNFGDELVLNMDNGGLGPNKKRVLQISYDGLHVINSFESVRQAARSTGVPFQLISHCLNGRQLTTHGYRWQYDNGKKYPLIYFAKSGPLGAIPVAQIDKNTGEIINIYCSSAEAARQTGLEQGNISSCANFNPGYSHTGGYIWRKVSQEEYEHWLARQKKNRVK